jgi:pimeloyl-ACP methyl ester carboxylesterase
MMKSMDAAQDPRALAAQRLGNPGLVIEYTDLKANVPVLVLYAEHDNPARFTDLKNALPGAEFKVIDAAGHGSAVQSPQFAADYGDFLDCSNSASRRLMPGGKLRS